jgi:ABC-2 type transport system ATP-binding protein
MAQLCSKGCSIFFSTHVLEVAEKLCHRIGIIKNGKLVAEGLVQDVIGDKSLESTFLDIAKESENE